MRLIVLAMVLMMCVALNGASPATRSGRESGADTVLRCTGSVSDEGCGL